MSKTHYFCTNHVLPCEFRHSMEVGTEYIKIMKSFSPWISVKDRLPERVHGVRYSQVPCLVHRNKDIEVLVFNHEHMCWDDRFGDDYVCDIGDVTHWMPLPEGPESYAASQPEKE